MIINHNLNAMKAFYYLNINQHHVQNAIAHISSGKRILCAADDPAGLGISQRMQAQINGLNQAARNAQDGISLLQTAEGGLNEVESILQRMNELAIQAANDTNTSLDRSAISSEINQLKNEIDHITTSNNFNNINLLGSSGNITFQIGATSNAYDQMGVNLLSINLSTLVSGTSISFDTAQYAQASISIIQNAINNISESRALIGAYQNRLNYTIDNLNNEAQNLTDAEAKITDADMAKEIMEYSKYNMLQQVAQAMLAQAIQSPDEVLKLLEDL